MRARNYSIATGIILALAGIDQWMKISVVQYFSRGGEQFHVTPLIEIVLAFNYGISFSFLSSNAEVGRWALVVAAMAISCIFLWQLLKSVDLLKTIAIAVILAGAIGNIIDRIRVGAVIDFLKLELFGFPLFVFNPADAFISTGVILYIAHELMAKPHSSE